MRLALALALLAGTAAAPAATVLKTAPAALQPGSGYVLVRIGERAPGVWSRLILAPYDPVREDIRGEGRAKANPVARSADRAVVVGPQPFLAETPHVRTYLVALTPGDYVIQSAGNTCFCLGSYRFDVPAGRITDLGTVYAGPENGTSPWAPLKRLHSSPDIEARGYTVAEAIAVIPARAGTVAPAGIAALPREAAHYLIARRFGNHHGQLVNQALPIREAS